MILNRIKFLLTSILCFAVLLAFPLYAQEENEVFESAEELALPESNPESSENQAAPVPPAVQTEITTNIGFAGSTRPEMKLVISQDYKVPFMQGNHPLFRGNNLKFSLKGEAAPIFMMFYGNVVFTPIALIELDAGGMVGTGWNIGVDENGQGGLRGIGVNKPYQQLDKDDIFTGKYLTSIDGSAFGGTFLAAHFGAAFQFNLAAVMPGDWNHIIMKSYHKLACNAFTGANKDEPWFIFGDYGENRNGWRYYANHVIGYQMPALPILKMVGFHTEMEKFLYNTPDGENWGDNLARWDLGMVFNLGFKNFSLAILPQFRLYRNYENYEYYQEENIFFMDRELKDGFTLKFYRVAFAFNYQIR